VSARAPSSTARYPGIAAAVDGNTAIVACEREASDAAGAFPITPSTQMGEGWAEAAAAGHLNIANRPLIFIEPEGEHAAAAVTAGLSMGGLRAANFSSGQGIAYMHESLYAAVGKRLTYVLNMGCRAMTKATLNVHAGHDDYHCVDDTGFFQLFAKNAQHAADLNVIAHRIAELALNPGIVAQDGFLTTHLIESVLLPERALIAEYLGRPDDIIETPTAAQRMLFGERRRRVPELWDVDNPVMVGVVQNQDAYMQSVAAQRPYFFAHIADFAKQAFAEFAALTGRAYAGVMSHRADDADYLILAQGSAIPTAEAVADHLRESRRLKVGVLDLVMFRPFPEAELGRLLEGKKGVVVLERLDQPLAADLPVVREVRAVIGKCLENGRAGKRSPSHPDLPAYRKLEHAPEVYSASFGLGSRDLQPEAVIGAVENMLPEGDHRKHFYLGIDFLRDAPLHPKDEIHQQSIEAAYPEVRALTVRGSENPNLMPRGSTTVRMHSIGGWGAITTGKNLATTLFDLLGYHIKANPKYGSEKKGQPTTFYLAAAPEPIRVNCEWAYVDVVLSPDPNVFNHTNALAGLREGGLLVIQSDAFTAADAWSQIPARYQQIIRDQRIRVFFLNAFRIAREEATDPELELRMQGIAFQGAFFAATPLMAEQGFDETQLLEAIRGQLQHKFGHLGARVVEENIKVIKRGYDELQEITALDAQAAMAANGGPMMPARARTLPASTIPLTDIHRYWEQTGSLYASGRANDNLADPFTALSAMPASTSLFRDMTGIRACHPEWIPENCTACGKCWTVCPDTALPGLVNDLSQVLDTAVAQVRKAGHDIVHLPAAVRALEAKLKPMLTEAGESASVRALLKTAMENLLEAQTQDREALANEFEWLDEALGDFQFALTRPFYTLPEKDAPGSGGLLSITVNPYTCKGCAECIAVCEDEALIKVPQTSESVDSLKANWNFWTELPSTPEHFIRVDDLEERIGVLDNILLDKDVYLPFASGDGACLGCSEKTVLHLFVATVIALMQPRVRQHVSDLEALLEKLEKHVQLKLIEEIDVEDTETLTRALDAARGGDLTLAALARQAEADRGETPISQAWLARVAGLIAELKDLIWRYREGPSGRGRADMGILNATGCSSVWGSTWPFNPYPFPWANHLFQDSASMAMGVFEAHMAKMAGGFAAVRKAELELAGEYRPEAHDEEFQRFDWRDFSEAELKLCPPVVVVGGDGAMYDIGLQNLSRAMASGKPLKVVVLDTQVYSNTGGQACTSGFLGQISDMAAFGAAARGKQEVRKEISLIAMAHRTTYVAQSTISHPSHLIESFIEGLTSPRPALFNCYTSCQPEHGIGDDKGAAQAKLAVESRAYPLLRYDPDAGETMAERLNLSGNPALADDWPTYTVSQDGTRPEESLELPMTFADFAATETRFRKHFRTLPKDTWHEDMVPLAGYLALDSTERENRLPFIWSLTPNGKLLRLRVSDELVASSEDRLEFWHLLREMAGLDKPAAEATDDAIEQVRREVVGRIAANLFALASDASGDSETQILASTNTSNAAAKAPAGSAAATGDGYSAPWIESESCTACDECTNLNPAIFAYGADGRAFIKDAKAGPYSDLVKAAERCTARVIHPGLPTERGGDMDRWIARAEKYN
jgi:pyruvate-ferredoxin/flavodoxin oxidoreductase